MHQKKGFLPYYLIFSIPFLLILFSITLAFYLPTFDTNSNTLASALTIDFVFTVPIVYLILIRKSSISPLTVMPFFIGGLIIASFVIPAQQQVTLSLVKTWVLPLVELFVFSIVIHKIRKVRKEYKLQKEDNVDFFTALKESTTSLFPPKIATAIATEISLIYFTFFAWGKQSYHKQLFSYHKESGVVTVLGVFLGVALIELFVVHLLLQNSYPILSWVLSGISIYGIIQIIGLMKSIPRTPIYFTPTEVVIRMGILQEAKIPFSKIENIELTINDYPEDNPDYKAISFLNHNCILHLNEEETLNGIFGTKKQFKHLVLSVDEKERFKKQLEDYIVSNEV